MIAYIRCVSSSTEQSRKIELQLPATTSAGTHLRYQFVNNSDYGVLTGAGFGLDHESAGGWEAVELGMAVAAIGIIIEPGQSRELHAPIPDGLAPGNYRLRQAFRLGPREGFGWAWPRSGPPEFEVAATFRVTTT